MKIKIAQEKKKQIAVEHRKNKIAKMNKWDDFKARRD